MELLQDGNVRPAEFVSSFPGGYLPAVTLTASRKCQCLSRSMWKLINKLLSFPIESMLYWDHLGCQIGCRIRNFKEQHGLSKQRW